VCRMREAGRNPSATRCFDYLEDKHLLVMLDNLEHLLAAGPVIAGLLSAKRRAQGPRHQSQRAARVRRTLPARATTRAGTGHCGDADQQGRMVTEMVNAVA
jgi:hypothetical protein